MRALITCSVTGLGVLLALVLAPHGSASRATAQDLREGAAGAVDARALFAEQCASCHVTPDPKVATDLAFLRQLQETA